MNHVWAILAVGLAGKMVDDAESLHALHDILEVDVLVVALALSLLQRSVLAVFYADGEVRARNLMLAFGIVRRSVLAMYSKSAFHCLGFF